MSLATQLKRAAAKDKKRPPARGKGNDDAEDLIGVFDRASKPMREKRGGGARANILDFEQRGIWLSLHQFCQETGKDRASIDKRIRMSTLQANVVKGVALYRLNQLIELVFYRDDSGAIDIDKQDAFRRKAHYAAELDKMRMQQQSGLLVPAIEVEQQQAHIFKMLAQFYDTIPDVLERDCGATPEMLKKIETRLDSLRQEMYKAITENADGSTSRALPAKVRKSR